MRRQHKLLLFALIAAAPALAALATTQGSTAAESSPCLDCHEEQATTFSGSPHGKAFLHEAALAEASCESCHRDSATHAESGDPEDILAPRETGARAANAACLSCHENQTHNAYWSGSAHEAADLSCTDCHAIHAPAVSKGGRWLTNTNELCLSCHTSSRVGLNQRSHHPLREGKMDCADCHDPHGSTTEKLVKRDSVNDLCLSCHQELRGPFLWEHGPVREDCLTCHSPHGSNHDKMLVARASQLCQSCHLQGRHQTVAGLSTSIWNSNRACLNCHSQIHGSNHPSGPLFQR